ncbi:unnamed protein product [Dovyalis caffra]|uniref:Uncharacterized protein n=1 Tax=Dovyalis caffra TaxID=77055 RepID=A0AAV1S6Y3_9ROSI|nr:unnamed protein product [Dovyalis caffra]
MVFTVRGSKHGAYIDGKHRAASMRCKEKLKKIATAKRQICQDASSKTRQTAQEVNNIINLCPQKLEASSMRFASL